MDSLPFSLKTPAELKKKPIPQNHKPFAKMLEDKNELPVKTVSNIADEVALMEHTGGTSGTLKAVCRSFL